MKFVTAALAFMFVGVSVGGAGAQQINGAGGTFPDPVYKAWAETAKSAIGVEVNYGAVGSGAGQNAIISRTVDFGASDAPVDPAKLASAKLVQFPTVIGAVVPIVNLPDISSNQLKLTGEVLADIYLGKITKWNDKAIAALNSGVKLPSTKIAPVYRAEASGTTFVFTSYLAAVSSAWKSQVGAATSVQWAAGEGANGNAGVAASVKQSPGAIGYVEYAFAATNNLTTTELRNRDGKFVSPTLDSFAAAATSGDWSHAKDYAVSLLDEPGAKSWPIVSTTFVLLPKDAKDPAKTAATIKFFDWAFKNGEATAKRLNYIVLPAAVQDQVRKTWQADLKAP